MPLSQADIQKSAEILQRHGAARVLLFGSGASSPETARDIDLAVDGIEGWDFFRASAELERELDVDVDLVPLSPASNFSRHIERIGRVLYERR